MKGSWRDRLALKLRALRDRAAVESDLEDEFEFHLAMEEEKLVATGMSPGEARRAARLRFGGVERHKERTRDAWGLRWLDDLGKDLRYGLRSLRRTPGFTVVVVLTLGLGIGANAAIFSVVNGLLLERPPYPDPDRLVTVWFDLSRLGGPAREWPDPANLRDWQELNTSFTGLAAIGGGDPVLTTESGSEHLTGAYVTANTFAVLGVPPAIGRSFLPEEDVPDGAAVAVLSHRLWLDRFGADPAIIGRTIDVDRTPTTVVGVMPEGFRFVHLDEMREHTDIYLPLQPDPEACGRGCFTLRVIGRLRPGVGLAEAQARMSTIAAGLEAQYPDLNEGIGVTVVSLREQIAGPYRPGLLVLMAAVGLLLLIACANVAGLLLARASARECEVAVRTALGAGRPRLVRQFLTETLLLFLLGGVVGTAVAAGGVRLMVSLLSMGISAPHMELVRLDGRVLAFAAAVAALTGLAFGVVPAFVSSSTDLASSLKEGSRGSTGRGGQRLRRVLVVMQVALAMTLLAGSSLVVRGFLTTVRQSPGFEPEGVLAVTLNLPEIAYPDRDRQRAFFEELLERLHGVPGVRSAGAVSSLPAGGDYGDVNFWIEGREKPRPNQMPDAWLRRVTPGYFATMEISVTEGRGVGVDDRADSERVAVINEAMARRWWPAEDPLGARMLFGSEDDPIAFRVVGVVNDVRAFGLGEEERPAMYLPFAYSPRGYMSVVVRTAGDPAGLAPAVRAEIAALDPYVVPSSVRSMKDVMVGSISPYRALSILMGLFAGLAVFVASIGLYGLLQFSVSRRVRELGVRMALGAARGRVEGLVVREGMRLAAIGLVLGLLLAAALSRLLQGVILGLRTLDPVSFLGVPLLLLGLALIASWIPARKAGRLDPVVALRSE